MKTMILGFLVLTLALGFTSCGDKEDDPKPTETTLVGTFKTISVVFNGNTITDACDVNWGSVPNMRKIDLVFKGGVNNFTDLINYKCVSNTTVTNTLGNIIASLSNNILDLGDSYQFKLISYNNNILKLELLSTTAITTPIGAVYTLSKQ